MMNSFAILVVVSVLGIVASDSCVVESPCVIQTSAGHFIDLTPITKITKTNDKDGTSMFEFNPCSSFACKNSDDALACDSSLNSKDVLIPKGNTATCMEEGNDVALQYKQNSTVLTVTLKCDFDGDTNLQYESGSETDGDYKFALSSRYACDNSTTAPPPKTSPTTKSPSTSKTTPKSPATSKTTPKSPATSKTTPKSPATSKTTPKSPATSKTTPKSPATSKTTPKSPATSKTTPKSPATSKTTPKSPASKTTPKSPATKTTPKGPASKTTPKNPKTTGTTQTTTDGSTAMTSAMSLLTLTTIIVGINRAIRV